MVQRAVQQCEATPVYQCTCVAGYNGDACEVGGGGQWFLQIEKRRALRCGGECVVADCAHGHSSGKSRRCGSLT
eukprot:COSAG06_NODE_5650_length_3341_cov_39.940988_1_plen_73_part_10